MSRHAVAGDTATGTAKVAAIGAVAGNAGAGAAASAAGGALFGGIAGDAGAAAGAVGGVLFGGMRRNRRSKPPGPRRRRSTSAPCSDMEHSALKMPIEGEERLPERGGRLLPAALHPEALGVAQRLSLGKPLSREGMLFKLPTTVDRHLSRRAVQKNVIETSVDLFHSIGVALTIPRVFDFGSPTPMQQMCFKPGVAILAALLIGGCAAGARQLMPTPMLYRLPGGQPVFDRSRATPQSPDLDLLFITDRAPATPAEVEAHAQDAGPLPYGQERARRIAFGSAQVRVVPTLDWDTLREQSQLAKRSREVDLELGQVRELGAFPQEPYQISKGADGKLLRDREELARHFEAKARFQGEVERRLAAAPKKDVLLYVHGFNETFATAAYTAAELCHFLGREDVCAFFTWPASTTGNFLTSYTTTTESAEYSVAHLKKTIRMLGTTPGVTGLQILAHSRGTALTLRAVHELATEAIAAGKEPAALYKIDNLVLLSPDIDVDVAGQEITSFLSDPDLATVWPEARLPRFLKGRLTIYTSPEDRALLVSRILFRSRNRVGQLRPEDMPEKTQRYFETLGRIDLISYQGKRTDLFGHSYFTTNPQVSSDLIELIRYGKRLGEPGRKLIKTGPVTWKFPPERDSAQ